jgi:hypothetical protein
VKLCELQYETEWSVLGGRGGVRSKYSQSLLCCQMQISDQDRLSNAFVHSETAEIGSEDTFELSSYSGTMVKLGSAKLQCENARVNAPLLRHYMEEPFVCFSHHEFGLATCRRLTKKFLIKKLQKVWSRFGSAAKCKKLKERQNNKVPGSFPTRAIKNYNRGRVTNKTAELDNLT